MDYVVNSERKIVPAAYQAMLDIAAESFREAGREQRLANRNRLLGGLGLAPSVGLAIATVSGEFASSDTLVAATISALGITVSTIFFSASASSSRTAETYRSEGIQIKNQALLLEKSPVFEQ